MKDLWFKVSWLKWHRHKTMTQNEATQNTIHFAEMAKQMMFCLLSGSKPPKHLKDIFHQALSP